MEADTEMRDAATLSDADSLASTAPSEQDSEYEVEEILAERSSHQTGKKKFLLKWAHYPIDRATWEPAEMFLEMDDTMLGWKEKRRRVAAGMEQDFDVDIWRRAKHDRERETRRRKEARRRKRAERAARKNDKPLPPSVSNGLPDSRESSSDAPLMQASRASSPDVPLIRTSAIFHKPGQRSSSFASDISSLFVSSDDPEPESHSSKGSQPPSTLPTAQSLQDSSFNRLRVGLGPQSSSKPSKIEPGPPEIPRSQPSQDFAIPAKKTQPTQPLPQTSESAETSRASHPVTEISKTATSKLDKASDKGPSQNTGDIPATGAKQTGESQSQRSQTSSSQPAKQLALGPLYTAFAPHKSKDPEPDITQLDLRKPTEFPARTAAGVPVPFAKMTASDSYRRGSQGGIKTTAASSRASLTGSSEAHGPPSQAPRVPQTERLGRSPPTSPRGPPLRFGDSYRPSRSRRSPLPRRPGPRERSPDSRRRSDSRSRSPDRSSRPREARQRSPVSRRRSPDHHRAADCYRPAPSPFVTVTRPKSASTSTRSPPPALVPIPATITDTRNDTPVNGDALVLSARPSSPSKEPPMSAKDQIKRMPIGKREPGCMTFRKNNYFVNRGEVLAHIYFGTEKHLVGVVRLCGLTAEVKDDLLAAKDARGRTTRFEMWFKDVCTPDQYATLCQAEESVGGSNRVLRTCWMEGFADTNPELFHMSELLRWENKVGIYYPPRNVGYVWLAYSPKSPEFTYLTQPYPDIDPWVPIRLAVRTPLPSLDSVKNVNLRQLLGPRQLQSPALAMVPYGPSNPALTGAPGSLDEIVRRLAQTSSPSNLDRSIQSPVAGPPDGLAFDGEPARESESARPTAPAQATSTPADPRIRRLLPGATGTQQPPQGQASPVGDGLDKSNKEHPQDANTRVPFDPMDTEPDKTVPIHAVSFNAATQNSAMNQLADPNSMLSEYFEHNLKLNFKELANVNGKRDGPQADVFFLHIPEGEEAQNDCTLLKAWLETKGAMIWSDWARFVKNSSKCNVILFHESFGRYDALRPNIRDALGSSSMGFWTFRISRPLDYPDVRYCQQGVYFQRIFNRGGAYLLTEDVLLCLKEAIVIVYFFHTISRSNPGLWKLACWPNLIERLEERLEDSSVPKDEQKLLFTLGFLIRKCNSIDPELPSFHPDSLDPTNLDSANNNVVSLKVAGYGERSADATPNLPADLTQTERNADHLAEAFAGWTIENAARLRKSNIISNCKNEVLLKRWAAWGHVTLYSVESFIEKYKINVNDMLDRIQTKLSKPRKPSKPSQSGPSSDKAHADFSSPTQTPQTPMVGGGVPTPKEPHVDPSTQRRPSEWKAPQPQEGHQYQAPYR